KLMGRMTKVSAKQRRSMRKAAARIRSKIQNLVDELHKKSAHFLTTNYQVIFLPTFETSQMVKRAKRKINKKSARQMLTWAHYRFKQIIKHQADKNGSIVVDVSEAYTSKTCGNHVISCYVLCRIRPVLSAMTELRSLHLQHCTAM
ncbi:IS200/IS605 family accessory protein TnpB-related protein, partial [Microcoleus sp. PH2017_09_SFU_O_A]|uniref:zinc ribbon domain-containing protein n=2 Tax=unclassified Microcoleus TaxID=2642155 RepID=UPI0025DB171A